MNMNNTANSKTFNTISSNTLNTINCNTLSTINSNALNTINSNTLSAINSNTLSAINSNTLSTINSNTLNTINSTVNDPSKKRINYRYLIFTVLLTLSVVLSACSDNSQKQSTQNATTDTAQNSSTSNLEGENGSENPEEGAKENTDTGFAHAENEAENGDGISKDQSGIFFPAFSGDKADAKIAIICENQDKSGFIQPILKKADELSNQYGFTLKVFDALNSLDWEEDYSMAEAEGYDLIIGVGWSAADYARLFSEKDDNTSIHALIDANAYSENVASITYNSLEASYIIGVMAASAFPSESKFGCITAFGDSYAKAFEEGLLSVNPDATLDTRLTFSYSDEGAAKDIALAMADDGIKYLYFTAGAAFGGVYDATLELAKNGRELYSNSQDTDGTDSANPYILTSQLKKTDRALQEIIENFYSGNLVRGNVEKFMDGGSIGVVHVTDSGNYKNETILTDEVIDACITAQKGLLNDSITLKTRPDDRNEVIN